MTNAELQSAIDIAHLNGGRVDLPIEQIIITTPIIHRTGVHIYGHGNSTLKASKNHT